MAKKKAKADVDVSTDVGTDVSVDLSGGELTDKEMATLMETGVVCEEDGPQAEAAADAAAVAQATEIINPVTGAIVSLDDIDSLILGCDECKKLISELEVFYRTLREAAWAKTAGTTKTRRLKGKKYQAKLEQGPRYPVGSILKEAYNAFPQHRDQYLKIGKIDLQMREVAKLEGMASDDPSFNQFKGMIKDAIEKGSEGLPSISMEGDVT